jgi:hypothetical protein
VFEGSIGPQSAAGAGSGPRARKGSRDPSGTDADRYLKAEELLPKVDIDNMLDRVSHDSRPASEPESGDARLLLLEGSYGVLLETSEGASAHV